MPGVEPGTEPDGDPGGGLHRGAAGRLVGAQLPLQAQRLGRIGPRGQGDQHRAAAGGAVDLVQPGPAPTLVTEPVGDQRAPGPGQRADLRDADRHGGRPVSPDQSLQPPSEPAYRPHTQILPATGHGHTSGTTGGGPSAGRDRLRG